MGIIGWIVFSAIVGFAAYHWGRNGILWFIISLLISPLIAAILVYLLPAKPVLDMHVRCPECRELVLKDARLCKHCGTRLVPQVVSESKNHDRNSAFNDTEHPLNKEHIKKLAAEITAKNDKWVCLKCLNEFKSEVDFCKVCNSGEFIATQ